MRRAVPASTRATSSSLGTGSGRKCAGVFRVDPVERQGVEVEIEVEGGAEALDEADGATLGPGAVPATFRAPAQAGEKRAEEGAQFLPDEAGHGVVAFPGAHEKALELLAYDGVQRGLFRAAWLVAPCRGCGAQAGEQDGGRRTR
jgi:hypothetical protein